MTKLKKRQTATSTETRGAPDGEKEQTAMLTTACKYVVTVEKLQCRAPKWFFDKPRTGALYQSQRPDCHKEASVNSLHYGYPCLEYSPGDELLFAS